MKSKIEFRAGTHNPYTIYVAGEAEEFTLGGRTLPGWMREKSDGRSEWFVGSLPHEALAMVTVEALNAFVCEQCTWGCTSCSLNRATCECYEHGDYRPTDADRQDLAIAKMVIRAGADMSQVGALVRAINATDIPGQRQAVDIATDLLAALDALGWRLIHD